MIQDHDFCVIGGGIVGLATAHALLQRYPGRSVVVLEKEDRIGVHQSGHNSGVIHSGIYYAPGSLKARLCAEGERRTKAFCDSHKIPYQARGKLIVATNALEQERLGLLAERAVHNGIETELISDAEIAAREPNITGLAALHVPASAIVSYPAIMQKLAALIAASGGTIKLNSNVVGIDPSSSGVKIQTSHGVVSANYLIACAGLQSDRIAKMAGLDPDYRIVPFRGEYYRVRSEKSNLTKAMIYPVPDPDLPFLGIHLTPMIDGSLTVGPNAVLGLAREGYAKGAFDLADMGATLTYPGFWRVALANIGAGIEELGNSLFKRRYLKACQKYCPSLELEDLQPMEAGIRAQAVDKNGALEHDFLYMQTDRMLHICNAPSPAATSALPIADMIVDAIADGVIAN